jgi:hypothetical protein
MSQENVAAVKAALDALAGGGRGREYAARDEALEAAGLRQ